MTPLLQLSCLAVCEFPSQPMGAGHRAEKHNTSTSTIKSLLDDLRTDLIEIETSPAPWTPSDCCYKILLQSSLHLSHNFWLSVAHSSFGVQTITSASHLTIMGEYCGGGQASGEILYLSVLKSQADPLSVHDGVFCLAASLHPDIVLDLIKWNERLDYTYQFQNDFK